MKILLLGEMMNISNASFRIQMTFAEMLAQKGITVDFIYPSTETSFHVKKQYYNKYLRTITTPGILPAPLRRGGFGLLDLLCKLYFAITGKYDIIHVTCGHRPAQLIPALCGKLLSRSIIIDEWWEWYGSGGRADFRKGIINKLLGTYDNIFELKSKSIYDVVIAISSFLKSRLHKNANVVVMNGGAETTKLIRYDKSEARKKIDLPTDIFLIGLTNIAYADHNDNEPFLEALEDITSLYKNIRLFVTGEPKYIEKEILKRSISKIIIYKGWLHYDCYNIFLGACDLFVLPLSNVPRNAGRWPHKIGDYICIGRPIISNPTGDLIGLFSKYRVGLLCENNKIAYTELLKKIMHQEIDLDIVSQESTYVAENVLSLQTRADNIIKLYNSYAIKRN